MKSPCASHKEEIYVMAEIDSSKSVKMKIKALGGQGIMASELGLGCMGMSDFYGPRNDQESVNTLHRALELGINFWDTADMYGPYTNEELVGKALKGHRAQVTLATKFGILRDPNDPAKRGFNGRPEYVRKACEDSLRRLNVETIDLYYLHRKDPQTPIEDTVGAMAQLLKEGKIRGIGLSEVSAATLRKAHGVHPISALQTEFSLWTRDPEEELIPTCRELNIAFVAYSPLGRGFLTGRFKSPDELAPDDFRRHNPRFIGENFTRNLALVDRLEKLAANRKCTPAQLALAWVLNKGEHVFAIPGTKRVKYLEENAKAADIRLTDDELNALDQLAPKGTVAGLRYTEDGMRSVNM